MHISEGVLNAQTLGIGALLTVAGLGIGLRKMDYEKLPEVAVLASVFFIASLVHVPIGPSAAHLILTGMCGMLLGWAAFPALFVGLALQSVLFGFGGITTLGVNTFNMAFPAVALGTLSRRFIRDSRPFVRYTAEFVAGAGAIMLSGILVALCLTLSLGQSIDIAARLIILAHIPVMIIEGLITVFIVEFVRKIRPEMIQADW